MTGTLTTVYGLVGCAIAGAAWSMRQKLSTDVVDGLLLLLLWPLYAPLFLLRGSPSASPSDASSLLLEEPLRRALEQQLARARAKIDGIDEVLGQPEFDPEAAASHRRRLELAGQDRAAARVEARLHNVARLRKIRHRYAGELAEIEELQMQIRLQAAVVRLAGEGEDSDLVASLMARVEALDSLMEESLI